MASGFMGFFDKKCYILRLQISFQDAERAFWMEAKKFIGLCHTCSSQYLRKFAGSSSLDVFIILLPAFSRATAGSSCQTQLAMVTKFGKCYFEASHFIHYDTCGLYQQIYNGRSRLFMVVVNL